MESLEAELNRARDLDVAELADAIESIGFECTRCGACCKGYDPEDSTADEAAGDGHDDTAAGGHSDREPHTATVFPNEVREIQESEYDWRDVARPMPYGLTEDGEGNLAGETFEWALKTDDCGNCTFYAEDDGEGTCSVHGDRPLICRTYPFSVALGGTSQPMGEAIDEAGMVRAHECEGLGRDIDREEAEELAAALKERAVRELTEAIDVREEYKPSDVDGIVVHDSEGAKRPDGTPLE